MKGNFYQIIICFPFHHFDCAFSHGHMVISVAIINNGYNNIKTKVHKIVIVGITFDRQMNITDFTLIWTIWPINGIHGYLKISACLEDEKNSCSTHNAVCQRSEALLTVVTNALSRVSPWTALVSACALLSSLCVIIALSLVPWHTPHCMQLPQSLRSLPTKSPAVPCATELHLLCT